MSAATDFDPFVRPQVGALEAARAAGPTLSGGFGFSDFLDVINPLQHLPIIGSLYRAASGDEIGGPARVLGGALYGGPVGLVMGAVNAALDEAGSRDLGERVLQAFARPEAPAGAAESPELATTAAPAEAAPPAVTLAAAQPPRQPAAPNSQSEQKPEQVRGVPAGSPLEAEEGTLTGLAALRAFAADRRRELRPAATLARAEGVPPDSSFRPLKAADFAGPRPSAPAFASHAAAQTAAVVNRAAAAPPAAGPALPSGSDRFTQRMLEALIKYQALTASENETAAE